MAITERKLIPDSSSRTAPHKGNGTHHHAAQKSSSAIVSTEGATTNDDALSGLKHEAALPAEVLSEADATNGRGWRAWRRAAQIGRVLGMLALYLFLENYDARAKFNRRMAARLREEARRRGRIAFFQEWSRDVDRRALDQLIRMTRFVVFRGGDGSRGKVARHEKQARWLSRHLIALGPTFIKIGQALGTRGDLLPLPYVKELATLQDQVPPFPTHEAYARIEAEFGRDLRDLFAEIGAEPIAAASLGQVYRARLHSGEEVAVKVQRPRLRDIISFDIAV
ncbi:MAG TPA: AarF/UbiB family protein, partial [Pyrinomonadaceae bacterium]|nr:AarF/UbiB family protein [Pyrinomonadaceae bacterium]